ncbi:MAG: TolC family outer membrane protein, partial [Bdellovibrionales bacterium]|nr:TolC family outer membrane protein [Massilia sp.]
MMASGGASALSLVEAYEKARLHDPVYRAAFYANESGKEYRILGRSNLLPSISGSYAASKNRADIDYGTRITHPSYVSHSGNISLRQAVFNLDAWARYKQGQAQSNASAAQFDADGQALILRVVGAYIEALFADDQVALAVASRDMFAEQNKVNATLFKKGEGTKTDMLETQAKLDLAEAKLLEAKDIQLAARTTLGGIIGDDVTTLDSLTTAFRVRPADKAGFEAWKKAAIERNPELKAQMYSVEIARAEVLKARAGHSPRLDFVASYAKNDSETINTLEQKSTVRSIGVQLNVPIYAGGSVNASSRQAVANQERARADMEGKTNRVLLDLRKDYDSVASSVTRIEALLKAVDSAKLLMTATTQSIRGGVRINLDLLNAQEQLYVAQRDLAQARYTYLLGSLRLRAGSGALSSDDVRE